MFPEKAKLISLLIAALLAGYLVSVNVDRRAADWGITDAPVNEHGWPLVYLLRQHVGIPVAEQTDKAVPSRWPWPAGNNEVRTFSLTNLTTDIIVGTAIVLIVFMMTHTVLQRFLK